MPLQNRYVPRLMPVPPSTGPRVIHLSRSPQRWLGLLVAAVIGSGFTAMGGLAHIDAERTLSRMCSAPVWPQRSGADAQRMPMWVTVAEGWRQLSCRAR
jgi:hypothetical protein